VSFVARTTSAVDSGLARRSFRLGPSRRREERDLAGDAVVSAFEVWNDYDPSMHFVTAYPMTGAQGTEQSTVAYFAFEPGQHSGLHADDAEEVIYVADGEGEIFISGRQEKLEAGGFQLVPMGVQHDIYAYGDVTLRLLSFFPSVRVVSTYTEILMPFGEHVISSDTPPPLPQIQEISFDDLPPELADDLSAVWGSPGEEPKAGDDEAAAAEDQGAEK
jgi:quercetin dioxygenase-like cupin family protein